MTADAGLTRSTPARWARWAMEHATSMGGMERAITEAVRLAVHEALAVASPSATAPADAETWRVAVTDLLWDHDATCPATSADLCPHGIPNRARALLRQRASATPAGSAR